MPYSDPEMQALYMAAWKVERRLRWVRQHGPCAWCASDENLEVDHVNPAAKELQTAAIWSRRAGVRARELAKCQVLCQRCRRFKHSTLRLKFAYHGSATLYFSHKCRCARCLVFGQSVRQAYRKTQTQRAKALRRARRGTHMEAR